MQDACDLCGSAERLCEREIRPSETQVLRWMRCRRCKLVYLSERPSADSLASLYRSPDYWAGNLAYEDYSRLSTPRTLQARDRANWFSFHLGRPGKTLEVGCAAGLFLRELSALGHQTYGIELSRHMLDLAQELTPHSHLSQTPLEEADFAPETFHGLTAWGCDSNFPHLRLTYQMFHRWLTPGGLLAINFHDYDHPANRLKGRFKSHANALYFFNRKNLKILLESCGFQIVKLRTEWCWMDIATVYQHTGHGILKRFALSRLGRIPFLLPLLGSYRVLAVKRPAYREV